MLPSESNLQHANGPHANDSTSCRSFYLDNFRQSNLPLLPQVLVLRPKGSLVPLHALVEVLESRQHRLLCVCEVSQLLPCLVLQSCILCNERDP